jgi:hypothetical protein
LPTRHRGRGRSARDILADVASPEDTIVAKLEWSKMGDSERQLEDVAGILNAQGDALEPEYAELASGSSPGGLVATRSDTR